MSLVEGSGVTLANWQDGPWNRWSFRHVREVLATVPVRAEPSAATELKRRPVAELGAVDLARADGTVVSLERHFADSFTDAVVILHDGELVYEHYFGKMRSDSLHLSMSVAKSITGLLVGVLADRGVIEPERPITEYLPELSHSGFVGATVQQMLNMTASTDYWDEGPQSELVRLDIASGWRPPDGGEAGIGVLKFGSAVGPGAATHGEVFRYASLNTDLLALACERAGDARFAELLSELLWKPIGASSDADIAVDPAGAAIASGGLSATALDLARVGQLVLQDGVIERRQVVPEAWLAISQRDDGVRAATATGVDASYWNYWWRVAGRTCGLGIHGQLLAIDRAARVVIVLFSSWPTPENARFRRDQWSAIEAVVAALGS